MLFAICGLLVAAWGASYVLVASDTVHHVLADAMAAVTLLRSCVGRGGAIRYASLDALQRQIERT